MKVLHVGLVAGEVPFFTQLFIVVPEDNIVYVMDLVPPLVNLMILMDVGLLILLS